MWDDPVTEDPKAGDTEIWNFVNATDDAHPKHVHLVQFQVLDRRPFDVDVFQDTGNIVFTGPPISPDRDERPAWKDTVKANGSRLRVSSPGSNSPEGPRQCQASAFATSGTATFSSTRTTR